MCGKALMVGMIVLAAKAALEDAGVGAVDAVILQLAKQKDKGAGGKKKD